jgi:hypothetical protein
MIEAGIIPDNEDIELWDGVLYKLTKHELHNIIVMRTADAFRPVTPPGYHVREEKSSKDGAYSLPEPDVAVARGKMGDSFPDPPALERMALLVEVDHSTRRTDRVVKFSRYAARSVPVYWIIRASRRVVQVFDTPEGQGKSARYKRRRLFSGDDEIAIVIDGQEVGRVTASSLFPARPSS